jgi:hypothetical protein
MDLHDVGVLQPGDGLRLGLEARQLRLAGMGTGQYHLQGHGAAQPGLPRLVDNAHAAAAQRAQHLVARDTDASSSGGNDARTGPHRRRFGGWRGRRGRGVVAA